MALALIMATAAPAASGGRERLVPGPVQATFASFKKTDARSTKQRLAVQKARRLQLAASRPLEFGIYPGGGAGAVNGRGEPRPEIASLRQGAIDQLRKPAAPFVVHLYDAYTGSADTAAAPMWLRQQIDAYTASGVRVELVLRYRPFNTRGDTKGFVSFVRSRVRELGSNRNVTSFQITNEANITVAPDAADGAYRGATQALVSGVIGAKREATLRGFGQLAIGFNWADETGSRASAFFSSLRQVGGATFADSVDWVGVDAYPGTWGPALPSGDLGPAVAAATRSTLSRLRGTLLPLAGLPSAPIIFAESGYPTDTAQRTEAQQVIALRATVDTVVATRVQYGVIGYRWFDLRDADSGVASFESHYGLMNDDYSPKAAFPVYRDLIAQHA